MNGGGEREKHVDSVLGRVRKRKWGIDRCERPTAVAIAYNRVRFVSHRIYSNKVFHVFLCPKHQHYTPENSSYTVPRRSTFIMHSVEAELRRLSS